MYYHTNAPFKHCLNAVLRPFVLWNKIFALPEFSANSPVKIIEQDPQEMRYLPIKCWQNSRIMPWTRGWIHTLLRSRIFLKVAQTKWRSVARRFPNLAICPTVQQEQHRFVSQPFSFNLSDFTESKWAHIIDLVPQGAVVYVYYGRDEDLRQLQDMNIDMKGRVLLVRAGKNSYAEKVGDFYFFLNKTKNLVELLRIWFVLSFLWDLFIKLFAIHGLKMAGC